MWGIVWGMNFEVKEKGPGFFPDPFKFLAGDGRLERPAFGSGDQRSIHLS
jgi:hypothetical protein